MVIACNKAPAVSDAVHRIDPRIDLIIPADARLETLAQGFDWSEGPVWVEKGGYLLFTDIPKNTIYKWQEGKGLEVFMRPAGYSAPDPPGLELGVNGLAVDPEGNILLCDHGNRCVSRLDTLVFTKTVLAGRFEGKRFNSPNDLTVKSNGDIYFTDPPYGLKDLNENPAKEIPFNGVYRISRDGSVTLLTKEITFPNGIAFSPDEKILYVAISDRNNPVWMAFDVKEDGTLGRGRIFFDATGLRREGLRGSQDGLDVDRNGNIFASGPGGVHVFSPQGDHLGWIETGQATSNCTIGDKGTMLYITADMFVMRIRITN